MNLLTDLPPPLARMLRVAMALCVLAAPAGAYSQSPPDDPLPDGASWLKRQPLTPLAIVTQGARCWRFQVWVARGQEQFARGLMYVRRLAPDRGMLFALPEPRDLSMWMRNTFISLDLIFADENGRIVRIHPRATPHSLEQIYAGQPVRAVLELPGGTVAARGISVGDYLRHSHFGNGGCQDAG